MTRRLRTPPDLRAAGAVALFVAFWISVPGARRRGPVWERGFGRGTPLGSGGPFYGWGAMAEEAPRSCFWWLGALIAGVRHLVSEAVAANLLARLEGLGRLVAALPDAFGEPLEGRQLWQRASWPPSVTARWTNVTPSSSRKVA